MRRVRVGRYWKRVLAHAAHDTVHIFDPDKRRLFLVPVLFAVGSAVHLLHEGLDAVMGEITIAISYGVYAVGIVGMVLFIYSLISAPAKMEHRLVTQLEEARTESKQSPLEIEFTDDCNFDNVQSLFRTVHAISPTDRDEAFYMFEYKMAIRNSGPVTVREVNTRIYHISQPDRVVDWPLKRNNNIRPEQASLCHC